MPHVSLRVSDEEKKWMESYAKIQGANLSDVIKEAFFQKLEDEYDLNSIRKHEEQKAKGDIKYHTLADVEKELEFDK